MKGNYTRLKITVKTKPVRQREKSEIRPELLPYVQGHMYKCRQTLMGSAHSPGGIDTWGIK